MKLAWLYSDMDLLCNVFLEESLGIRSFPSWLSPVVESLLLRCRAAAVVLLL
jgi:hypothetical protein